MTEYQFKNLLNMKTRILQKVEEKELEVQKGAELLGITRQGFLKFRKQYRRYGEKALLGLKRGPKTWHRPWNRTPQELEEKVIRFREENSMDGPITISWRMEDEQGISIHHQTIYRILKRAGLIEENEQRRGPWQEVITSFPGERVQIDTCFP